MASATVYCRTTNKGIQSFYIKHNNISYYLFSQNYRKGIHNFYGNGVSLANALDFTKSGSDISIQRTMTKLPKYIKYIEKEYEIRILNKTGKKNGRSE